MKCKIGGDDWKNKEGYILIDGVLICSDWDVDCTQCLVEKCLELGEKWRAEADKLSGYYEFKDGQSYGLQICADELESILDISEIVVKEDVKHE